MARRAMIAGNWKMNGLAADGLALVREIDRRARATPPGCDVVVCPPATLLRAVSGVAAGGPVATGGQDCHNEPKGAFTGEVSAAMLVDAGAAWVILGHSERRHGLGETDEYIRAKVTAAHAAGLGAILCVGETEAERDAGQTLACLAAQIDGSLPRESVTAANTVIAYEPVWAIGTGRTPTLAEIEAAHAHMRLWLSTLVPSAADGIRLLYGGSVKADNAATILAVADVDGALVGGASLKADDFWAIVTAAPAGG
ncbi:MAG: triose-phosphate isomerase [Alphaproteobacteria bacterium]